MPGRVAQAVHLEESERRQLESFANSRSLPYSQVVRARIILQAAEGKTNKEIAESVGMTRETTGKWRKRYLERGIQGLYDELRPGKPRTIDDEKVAELIQATLRRTPEGANTLECAYACHRDRCLPLYGASCVAGIRTQAAPPGIVQAFHRSVLRRKSR